MLEMSVREALRCEVLLRVEIERPDAIAKLGPTALAAELQAAAEGGTRAAASAAQSQSCPQPPSPPPGFLALSPPPSSLSTPRCLSQEHIDQSFSRAHFEQSRPILLRKLIMKADLKDTGFNSIPHGIHLEHNHELALSYTHRPLRYGMHDRDVAVAPCNAMR